MQIVFSFSVNNVYDPMVLFPVLLVIILLVVLCSIPNVQAAPCDPQSISLTVGDEQGAQDLATALDCSDGETQF